MFMPSVAAKSIRRFVTVKCFNDGINIARRSLEQYERVIWSNEAIFSDLDENEELNQEISDEMSHRFTKWKMRHKKGKSHDESNFDIFGFSQELLNSSAAMMKFAILQAELQNVASVSLRMVRVFSNGPHRLVFFVYLPNGFYFYPT